MNRIVNIGVSALLTGGVLAPPALAQDFPPVEMEIIQLNDDMYIIHNEYVPGTVAAMRARTREMVAAESSREEIEAMPRAEFYWGDPHPTMGFDGLLAEL